MIRKYQPEDLPSVLNIWLQSNQDAHSFIAATCWESHLEYMKQVLPQAEVYVYEIQNQVVAFAGLENNYIAGIFGRLNPNQSMLEGIEYRCPYFIS